MVLKRPHASDDSHLISSKHIRRVEGFDHLVKDVCGPAVYDPHQNIHVSGECGGVFIKVSDEERSLYDRFDEFTGRTGEICESGPSGCIPHISFVSSGDFMEAETLLEPPLSLTLFPEYFASEDQLSALFYPKEACPSPMDCSSQKLVPIGPEHQAEIPEWGLLSDSDPMPDGKSRNSLIGTCVTPMPKSEGTVNNSWEAEIISCKCLDRGSIRCVQLHVAQAREKLKKSLGQEVFSELGFCDMGEEVANKWTDEERKAFHDVVVSNPLSLGKSFWDDLPEVLPCRRMGDFVSYYFNVYVLIKRAEQNRFDPQNIDSDDDEWERAEFNMTEDDDNSVVDSPTEQDAPAIYPVNLVEEYHEEIEDDSEVDTCKGFSPFVHGSSTDVEDEDDVNGVLESQFGTASGSCSNNQFQPLSKLRTNLQDDFDAQDDSCTSFESKRTPIT